MQDDMTKECPSVVLTLEHAVLITPVSGVKPILPYVEAIARTVGSNHIDSVFEDSNGLIKVYLDDKQYADFLVNNGVSVQGTQVTVDYAVQRADKITFTNVDPIVPDSALLKVLSYFGNITSKIIHQRISDLPEFSHIKCGIRKAYMELIPGKNVPSKIALTYNGRCFNINLSVERYERGPPEVEERAEEDDDVVEVGGNGEVAKVVEVEDMTISSPEVLQPAPIRRRRRRKNPVLKTVAPPAIVERQLKVRRARKGLWFGTKRKRDKQRLLGAPVVAVPLRTTVAAGPLRATVGALPKTTTVQLTLKKRTRRRVVVQGAKVTRQRKSAIAATSAAAPNNTNSSPYDFVDESSEPSTADPISTPANPAATVADNSPNIAIEYVTDLANQPLDFEEVKKFLLSSRFHREPYKLALEILTANKVPDEMLGFIDQLEAYWKKVKGNSLRARVKRLANSLKNAHQQE